MRIHLFYMVDVLTKKQRSYNMSQIKSKNTKPELKIRHFLYSKNIRGYRVNSKLPGRPDVVFTKYKLVIFIDGCFWHKCPKCYREPQTNKEYWVNKIEKNVERDKKVNKILKSDGWKVLRFYEHQIKNINGCFSIIIRELRKRGFSHVD